MNRPDSSNEPIQRVDVIGAQNELGTPLRKGLGHRGARVGVGGHDDRSPALERLVQPVHHVAGSLSCRVCV